MALIASWFEGLYQATGWNFSVFYNPWEAGKYAHGVLIAIQLALWALVGSLVVGLACVVGRTSRRSSTSLGRFTITARAGPTAQLIS